MAGSGRQPRQRCSAIERGSRHACHAGIRAGSVSDGLSVAYACGSYIISMTPSREQLEQWDREHVWHPFTPMQAYAAEKPLIIAAARGCFLIDLDGREYLDGVSSLWCNVHGHRVPPPDAALREQLDAAAHSTLLGLSNVPAIRLARRL